MNRYIKDYTKKKSLSDALSHSPSPDSLLSEQLVLIETALKEANPKLALKLCSTILKSNGVSPLLYEYASDAFIQLRKYSDAELYLVHAIALGGDTQKRCLNLVSLVSMRADFSLAKSYLTRAKVFDPSSELFLKSQELLYAKISKSTDPFTFMDQLSTSIS